MIELMGLVLDKRDVPEHIVLRGVSWSYYERTLNEVGRQSVRVTFLDGVMELMSPLPEHEAVKKAIGELVAAVASERGIPRKSFGSTTFRREEKSAGGEPDECFYFGEIDAVKGMKRFDPLLHRAPDLWIEVDLLSPSAAREPIYARLGVPEVWRCAEGRVSVRLLSPAGTYADSIVSRAFPFLPIPEFAGYITKMIEEDETRVLSEFKAWLSSLSR